MASAGPIKIEFRADIAPFMAQMAKAKAQAEAYRNPHRFRVLNAIVPILDLLWPLGVKINHIKTVSRYSFRFTIPRFPKSRWLATIFNVGFVGGYDVNAKGNTYIAPGAKDAERRIRFGYFPIKWKERGSGLAAMHVETRVFKIADICRWYDLPIPQIGDLYPLNVAGEPKPVILDRYRLYPQSKRWRFLWPIAFALGWAFAAWMVSCFK